MLVLSRKEGEEIVIGDNVRIYVTEIGGNRVRLAISAPRDLPILRGELCSTVDPTMGPVGAHRGARP
jgi:carbon storage regulator